MKEDAIKSIKKNGKQKNEKRNNLKLIVKKKKNEDDEKLLNKNKKNELNKRKQRVKKLTDNAEHRKLKTEKNAMLRNEKTRRGKGFVR